MLASFLTSISLLGAFVAAQNTSSVLCVAGQCLQGLSNTTIGATLSAPGAQTSVLLLPGQYSSTISPQFLHDLLTSSSASLSASPGFNVSSSPISLPLNLNLQPGLAIFSGSLYSGSSGFTGLPSSPVAANSSAPLPANSFSLSPNVWMAVRAGSNERVVMWDTVPDISQLPPTAAGSLSLLDIQSSACSPACSGNGICSASGTCTCAPGFTGSSCESCATGFFGPTCQPCPAGCSDCDQGITGTGRCLNATVPNAPATCNCINGQCSSNGQCTCNTGWVTADNGTACAKCAEGFFLTSTGDCKVCEIGCSSCADGSGTCVTCKSGFTQDANDKTKCDAVASTTSSGTVCPDGSFANGAQCATCSPSCQTCNGPTSNSCIICASGSFAFNGSCVSADSNGVCEGTNLIADNNKHECDSCGAKCSSCKIPNFSAASTVNQLQCTGCLPGSFLSNGQCVDSCPTGTFVSQDNVTCSACTSSCSTCSGSSTFCLSCANGQLASNGQCVSSCPAGTFSSSGSCLTCHPDCATCSGSSFDQCQTCPADRPVLNNGRCLPTCSKSQYFDRTSGSCQTCDSTCSSCSDSGPSNCLACSSSSQVLRAGSCVSATCTSNSTVVPGLGVCLSDLLVVSKASGTGSASPLPSITGIGQPTIITTTGSRKLAWWEILLMTLGCAFIFVVILMLWRRRARKQRAKRTALFAQAKNLEHKGNWRWRLLRFGEKLFGHHASTRVDPQREEPKVRRLRDAEEARHSIEMDKLISAYDYDRHSSRPSMLSRSDYEGGHHGKKTCRDRQESSNASQMSGPSIYSEMTGMPRNGPEVRQPVKKNEVLAARLSASTMDSSIYSSRSRELTPPLVKPPTLAEEYAAAVRPTLNNPVSSNNHWIEPQHTGFSSKNPFQKMI